MDLYRRLRERFRHRKSPKVKKPDRSVSQPCVTDPKLYSAEKYFEQRELYLENEVKRLKEMLMARDLEQSTLSPNARSIERKWRSDVNLNQLQRSPLKESGSKKKKWYDLFKLRKAQSANPIY